jgi:hypothetical protein
MKNIFKFILKAFFGGCIGCMGALTTMVVIIVILGLIFGPALVKGVTSFTQSIPEKLSQGVNSVMSSLGEGGKSSTPESPSSSQSQAQNSFQAELYLTLENKPDAEHITQFTTAQSTKVYFWVKVPQGIAVSFKLKITFPNGSQQDFGPGFSTDPNGDPVPVGQFGSQAFTGNYRLEMFVPGSDLPVGKVEFTVNS